MVTRVVEQQRIFFKKNKDTFLTSERPFSGDKYWEVVYTHLGVVAVTFWNSKGKHRYYSMPNMPKAIRAWLVVQGIPVNTEINKYTNQMMFNQAVF